MNMQVLTISPTGEVSGLQRKPGQGFDLRKLGKAQIERVSEIVWDEENQNWFISILRGFFADRLVSSVLWAAYVSETLPGAGCTIRDDGVLLFEDYDQAVKAEVEFLDRARLAGHF
jgi:hypothetical protein